ncbi:hypothetical protein J6590_038393 [Homalodisca vitripennis]|nr:hypothetical protein J6590_038393 [Homalodisca vitripennis]
MGSLYIMITVPSLEHEKSLWLEKNLGVQKHKKTISFSIEPNKSSSDVADNNKPSPTVLDRSLSDDSSMEKVGDVQSTNKERSQSDTHMPKIKNALSMEKRLENCLKELKIPNAVWVLGSQGKYHQVSFCTQAGEKCELIMQLLTENEIGVELNSTVRYPSHELFLLRSTLVALLLRSIPQLAVRFCYVPGPRLLSQFSHNRYSKCAAPHWLCDLLRVG